MPTREAIANVVRAAVVAGVAQAAALPTNDLKERDVDTVAAQVTPKVEKQVAAIVANATNTEAHWWQKRSVWAAIVSVAATIAGPLLIDYGVPADWMTPDTQEKVVTALVKAGGALSAYLAWRAGRALKPLGQ